MSTTAVSHFVTRCKTRWWRVCFSRLVWTVLKTQTLPTHYTCPAAWATPKKKRNQRFTRVNYTQLKQQCASSSVCLLHVQKFRFRVFLKFYVWPNGWHLRLCPPRPLANCRCVSVGVRLFWLGSCLSQNRENYKAEAVWGCMQAFIAPLLLACRAECSGGWSCSKWRGGDEIDRQCHSAHNRVWFHLARKVNRKMPQAMTQIYRNAPQKNFFLFFFFSPEAMWLIWLNIAMLQINQPDVKQRESCQEVNEMAAAWCVFLGLTGGNSWPLN